MEVTIHFEDGSFLNYENVIDVKRTKGIYEEVLLIGANNTEIERLSLDCNIKKVECFL